MPRLDRDGDVLILHLGDTENRFHPDWLEEVEALLDEAEAADGPRALVTAADGKFYSNGLDLDWLRDHPEQQDDYLARVHRLLARTLTLPMVTVAAVQGHAFAAGAMLALAHDLRVMRADRGFWCLPEADLHLPFTPGMSALIQARLNPACAHEAMVTARRYGGHDALACGIVEEAVAEDAVRPTAVERARTQATKAGPALAAIKAGLYGTALHHLHGTAAPTG
jgi:Delta3-Delta2-enoyl-CoA isomerase